MAFGTPKMAWGPPKWPGEPQKLALEGLKNPLQLQNQHRIPESPKE